MDDFDKLSDSLPNLLIMKKNPLMNSCMKCHNNNKSFLLLDGQENLQVPDVEEFLKKLNCTKNNIKVKVVSIFGNTGDGKSHTMNQVFFKGEEVFQTSNEQNCCTLGVWVAFDPILNVICLDTEGLQGIIYFMLLFLSKNNYLCQIQQVYITMLFCLCRYYLLRT